MDADASNDSAPLAWKAKGLKMIMSYDATWHHRATMNSSQTNTLLNVSIHVLINRIMDYQRIHK